jgi:CheY-like chemotaxis protein
MYRMAEHGDVTNPLTPADAALVAAGGAGALALAEPHLILLVEDDFILRGSLAALLEMEGYRVESAAHALDALRRLERTPKPSLILLDIMLPYMDGLEFRGHQRAIPAIADIPVVVLTAVGVRPDVAAELELRESLFKPVETRRLLDAIKRHCPPRTS